MKTFETEKHNIPEGATHYREETNRDSFAWVCFYPTPKLTIDGVSISGVDLAVSGESLNNLKPIPQTNIETPEEKEVEWVNGEILEYKDEDDEWEHNGRYVCYDDYGKHHVFTARDGMMYHASDDQVRKPETPQQREERERLEAAYDLYCTLNANHNCVEFDRFKSTCNNWLRVVDKTNYRKEG